MLLLVPTSIGYGSSSKVLFEEPHSIPPQHIATYKFYQAWAICIHTATPPHYVASEFEFAAHCERDDGFRDIRLRRKSCCRVAQVDAGGEDGADGTISEGQEVGRIVSQQI